MRFIYLFKFLDKHSGYFTSLGVFGVLLTLSFFLPEITDEAYAIITPLLQGTLLFLFIFCLFPLLNIVRKSESKVLQIFSVFLFLLILFFGMYLWIGYKSILIGAAMIISLGIGLSLFHKIRFLFKESIKNKKIKLKENWMPLLIFIVILFVNLIYLFSGGISQWQSQFINILDIVSLNEFMVNVGGYIFIGFFLYISLYLISIIFLFFEKLGKPLKRLFLIKKQNKQRETS